MNNMDMSNTNKMMNCSNMSGMDTGMNGMGGMGGMGGMDGMMMVCMRAKPGLIYSLFYFPTRIHFRSFD